MAELEELIFLKDFAERYHMGIKRARATMRSMPHHEKPLFVTISACRAWEEAETVMPATRATRIAVQNERRRKPMPKPAGNSKFIIPRVRPEV